MPASPAQTRLPSLAQLAAIIEGSDDAIIGKDLNGCIVSWNPGAERIFGYTADEMLGEPITRLIPADKAAEEDEILQQIQRGQRVHHFETIRLHRDGRRIHVSLAISPVRTDGTIVGASTIARDITREKEAEAALRQAQQRLQVHAEELEKTVAARTARLQELVSELEAFSYSLSHDLRAPLRAIQGFTEMVLTDHGARIPEAKEYLQRVLNASARMDRLIQDVLAFSRVARQDITISPVDLNDLVRGLIHERAELQPPRAQIEIGAPLLPVMGHPAALTQCLANLLDNAVKFVAPGVTPHVHLWTEHRDDYVRVNVQDNGIGIPAELHHRLFLVFQRLATQQPYPGTGLGLAIVRKAAERMDGRVGVESAPNQGSTFWVELRAVA